MTTPHPFERYLELKESGALEETQRKGREEADKFHAALNEPVELPEEIQQLLPPGWPFLPEEKEEE